MTKKNGPVRPVAGTPDYIEGLHQRFNAQAQDIEEQSRKLDVFLDRLQREYISAQQNGIRRIEQLEEELETARTENQRLRLALAKMEGYIEARNEDDLIARGGMLQESRQELRRPGPIVSAIEAVYGQAQSLGTNPSPNYWSLHR